MKIQIKSISGAVLFETEAESLRDAVIAAVEVRADLSHANLSYANLSGADLFGANLSYANLSGANLSGANLSDADLSGADLFGANLPRANLSRADLPDANLTGANLTHAILSHANLTGAILPRANLTGANLSRADLFGADLSGANLSGAKFAPPQVLLCNWSNVSDSLCADLMQLDATAHPNTTKFDVWANGGDCPYSGLSIQRIVNFQEKRELWGKGKQITIWEAMTRLFGEKNVKFEQ